MSKRSGSAIKADDAHDTVKRRKTDQTGKPVGGPITIHSASQLQQLLTFQQDAVPQLRLAVQAFKTFLDTIAYPKDESIIPRQRAVLQEFLDSQKPRDASDKSFAFLPGLMQAWSFAEHNNNDWLQSSVVAVLALLLKVISSVLELRAYGILLCKTILQPTQAKLLSGGLSAPAHKEHVISPCLRLLTEAVSFDGGALAKQIYSRRDFTFDVRTLVRNLHIRRDSSGDASKDRRKPSVRSNAVRYLLANFRFQDEAAKVDILKNGNVLRALFQHIGDDPMELVRDILTTIKQHVILDDSLPRATKSYVLNERNLADIASLYKFEQQLDEVSSQQKSIDILAHEFLLLVCTTPNLGALVPSSGWYPPGTNMREEEFGADDDDSCAIDLGLDSLEWHGRYRDRVPVRNTNLATFIQVLRPHARTLERALLLAIFKAAPELVADYFFKRTGFPFDPKLTATWIGCSSFLFSTVQLPVPDFFGLKDSYAAVPPPVSVIIESILPQPLSQKSLARCLNQKSELIKFFAVRLTIVAFRKLQTVIEMLKAASKDRPLLWEQASAALVSEFVGRCPPMRDVIMTFRSTPSEHVLQREAVTRLLAMYYQVTPIIAMEEKFDVSLALTSALKRTEESQSPSDEDALGLLELQHLLEIAHHSPGMRWWHKPELLKFSPFTTLVRLVATAPTVGFYDQVKRLLLSIVSDSGIVQQQTNRPALEALIFSLSSSATFSPTAPLFEFLDDCISRLVRRPIKYQDDLDSLRHARQEPNEHETESPPTISLLALTLAEQWPFVVKYGAEGRANVATWLGRYIRLSIQVGEDQSVFEKIFLQMSRTSDLPMPYPDFQTLMVDLDQPDCQLPPIMGGEERDGYSPAQAETLNHISTETAAFYPAGAEPPREREDHPERNRWMHKEPQEALEDGSIGALVMCLCSKHGEIRRQALQNIQRFIEVMKTSSYEEREQLQLLLEELSETCKEDSLVNTKPLPTVTGAWAAHAMVAIADPLHIMYPKINRYLTKGPSWNVNKLPSYWVDKIVLNAPDEDVAHHREVEWLLELLIDGLSTSEDMELYRASRVFERVLAMYSSPHLPMKLKEKVVKLLFRATFTGGSTILITRAGILSWIQAQLALKDGNARALEQLARRLRETCDWERVSGWSNNAIHILEHVDIDGAL